VTTNDDTTSGDGPSSSTPPHGWRRAMFGLGVGAIAGLVLGLVMPRRDDDAGPEADAD
jgi:hypothetical protein